MAGSSTSQCSLSLLDASYAQSRRLHIHIKRVLNWFTCDKKELECMTSSTSHLSCVACISLGAPASHIMLEARKYATDYAEVLV